MVGGSSPSSQMFLPMPFPPTWWWGFSARMPSCCCWHTAQGMSLFWHLSTTDLNSLLKKTSSSCTRHVVPAGTKAMVVWHWSSKPFILSVVCTWWTSATSNFVIIMCVWLKRSVPHILYPEFHHLFITPCICLEVDNDTLVILALPTLGNVQAFATENNEGPHVCLTIWKKGELNGTLPARGSTMVPHRFGAFLCIALACIESEWQWSLVNIGNSVELVDPKGSFSWPMRCQDRMPLCGTLGFVPHDLMIASDSRWWRNGRRWTGGGWTHWSSRPKNMQDACQPSPAYFCSWTTSVSPWSPSCAAPETDDAVQLPCGARRVSFQNQGTLFPCCWRVSSAHHGSTQTENYCLSHTFCRSCVFVLLVAVVQLKDFYLFLPCIRSPLELSLTAHPH